MGSDTPVPEALDAVHRAALRRDADLSRDEQRHRGVVHTPPMLALAVAQAAHERLQRHVGLDGGLGDRRTWLVDPACGPGVFLAAARSVAAVAGRPGACVGIDIDGRAVNSAETTLRPLFAGQGWPLSLRVADALELRSAADVFGEAPTDQAVVVMGNPPWAARSANRAGASTALLRDFAVDHAGAPLGERKAGALSDDYVRFFRWACEMVRHHVGGGMVALVTNASFLDGPVHRGMRARLLEWFDGIDTVDLGGSALIARRGDRDENVFGVRPAAAVTLAWRRGLATDAPRRTAVRAQSLRGSKEEKLAAMTAGVESGFADITPAPPFFSFRLRQGGGDAAYETWPSLPELLPFHQEGVQTNRDALVVDGDRERLLARLWAFAEGRPDDVPAVAWQALAHYDPDAARASVAAFLDMGEAVAVRPIAWRPGETRWFCPALKACHRPRAELLAAIAHGGAVLLTARKDRGERPWAHAGMAAHIPDNCWLSTRSSCRTRAFPAHRPDGTVNLSPVVAQPWSEAASRCLSVHDVQRYALAFLAAPSFQARFDGRLKEDYPRIPTPTSATMFHDMLRVGSELSAAFLTLAPSPGACAVVVGHQCVENDALAAAMAQADEVVRDYLRTVAR